MKPWLAKTVDGKYTIEKIPCPHPADPINANKPATGVLHTTEGGWSSAMSVFTRHYAPHFLVGSRRIAQLVPLGTMAAALENTSGGVETNRWARVQIEVVGYSKQAPYSFEAKTNDPLASLLATLKGEALIPLSRPFPDSMPPLPWSTPRFSRRHAGQWGNVAGWYGHVEVPENAHWDPGALLWEPLLLEATRRLPKVPVPKPAPRLTEYLVTVTNTKGMSRTIRTRTPWVYGVRHFGVGFGLAKAEIQRLDS